MTPFKPASLPESAFDVEATAKKLGVTTEQAIDIVKDLRRQVVYMNDLYQVNVTQMNATWIHLSVKLRTKQPVHDWRHLQQIKNELVGPEHEAIELYPAESRIVDGANQYHLWCLAKEGLRFPVGFDDGGPARNTPEQAAAIGAVQRAFDS